MPRLRNKVTGAVMSVPDKVAARLGSGWVDADKVADEPKEQVKRGGRPRKNESDD